MKPRVVMVQDGARQRYAVPVALLRRGLLERMYTQFFIRPGSLEDRLVSLLGRVRPGTIRSLKDRRCDEIPPDRVIQSLPLTLKMRRAASRFPSGEAFYAWEAQLTGHWILKHGFGDANALLGFIRNIPPEVCRVAQSKGLVTVADQMIAPAIEEEREMRLQHDRWPGWESGEDHTRHQIVRELEEQTWPHLTHITCLSDYVRQSLISRCNISPDRITVIPYALDLKAIPYIDRTNRPGPVTVGFIGSVGLRKGVQYFAQIAQRFQGKQVRFVLVGGSSLTDQGTQALRDAGIELVGKVPRSEVGAWLAKFDLFLFPSTCEGSAGSVIEAMGSGLPVVVSPNTGSVACEGIEGFIRNYDDIEGLTACVEKLVSDPALRQQMGRAGRTAIENLNLDWYANALESLFTRLVK